MSAIMVVENDAMSRELARRVLQAGGHNVVCVVRGEDAVQTATQTCPDLVLMDLHLPGIDGIETTRRLRARRSTSSTPIIILSAQAGGPEVLRAQRAGCDGYLSKPVGARELLDEVNRTLARHQSNRTSLDIPRGKNTQRRPR